MNTNQKNAKKQEVIKLDLVYLFCHHMNFTAVTIYLNKITCSLLYISDMKHLLIISCHMALVSHHPFDT